MKLLDYVEPAVDGEVPTPVRERSSRRTSDKILIAFHSACDQSDLTVAAALLGVLEGMMKRPVPDPRERRRRDIETLVAAHERLWLLKNAHRELLEPA